MQRRAGLVITLAATCFGFMPAAAARPSLDQCQRTAQREGASYAAAVHDRIAGCLQRISGEVIKKDAATPQVGSAVQSCVADLQPLGQGGDKSLRDAARDKILKACQPASAAHGDDDVLGTGSPSGNQTLEVALRLEGLCGALGGGVAAVVDWVDCILAAAECHGRQQVAVGFPRAVEWLELLAEPLAARTDVRGTEAHVALQAALAAIDGTPAGDGLADIACGGVVEDGTCADDLALAQADLGVCQDELDVSQSAAATCATHLSVCGDDVAACTSALDACLSDPGTPQLCGNGVLDADEDCDQSNLGGATCVGLGFAGGSLGCAAGCALDLGGCWPERFVDHGDGTITDRESGLMWEKKVSLGGGTNFADLQDADNTYRWSGICSGATTKRCQPDSASAAACLAGVQGDASACDACTGAEGVCNVSTPGITVWQWIEALNAANFAGYGDWRIPSRAELETLLRLDFDAWTAPLIAAAFHGTSCGAGCLDVTDPACACTRSDNSWSRSSYEVSPTFAWVTNFSSGALTTNSKTLSAGIRAVRGGQ